MPLGLTTLLNSVNVEIVGEKVHDESLGHRISRHDVRADRLLFMSWTYIPA